MDPCDSSHPQLISSMVQISLFHSLATSFVDHNSIPQLISATVALVLDYVGAVLSVFIRYIETILAVVKVNDRVVNQRPFLAALVFARLNADKSGENT